MKNKRYLVIIRQNHAYDPKDYIQAGNLTWEMCWAQNWYEAVQTVKANYKNTQNIHEFKEFSCSLVDNYFGHFTSFDAYEISFLDYLYFRFIKKIL